MERDEIFLILQFTKYKDQENYLWQRVIAKMVMIDEVYQMMKEEEVRKRGQLTIEQLEDYKFSGRQEFVPQSDSSSEKAVQMGHFPHIRNTERRVIHLYGSNMSYPSCKSLNWWN